MSLRNDMDAIWPWIWEVGRLTGLKLFLHVVSRLKNREFFPLSAQCRDPGHSSGRGRRVLDLLSVSAAEPVCGGTGHQGCSAGDGHYDASAEPRQLRPAFFRHLPLCPSTSAGGTRPTALMRQLRAHLYVQITKDEIEMSVLRGFLWWLHAAWPPRKWPGTILSSYGCSKVGGPKYIDTMYIWNKMSDCLKE